MTLFTWFMSAATSWIMGSNEGGVERRSGVTVAGMAALWRLTRTKASARLAPALARPHEGTDRKETNDVADTQLDEYRQSIDNIDAALIFLLAERFKVTQAVGRYKAKAGLPAADPGREAEQIARLRGLAQSARLDPDFSEKFLRFVIDEVIRHHDRVRESEGAQ
jgi:chorismate mutase